MKTGTRVIFDNQPAERNTQTEELNIYQIGFVIIVDALIVLLVPALDAELLLQLGVLLRKPVILCAQVLGLGLHRLNVLLGLGQG